MPARQRTVWADRTHAPLTAQDNLRCIYGRLVGLVVFALIPQDEEQDHYNGDRDHDRQEQCATYSAPLGTYTCHISYGISSSSRLTSNPLILLAPNPRAWQYRYLSTSSDWSPVAVTGTRPAAATSTPRNLRRWSKRAGNATGATCSRRGLRPVILARYVMSVMPRLR